MSPPPATMPEEFPHDARLRPTTIRTSSSRPTRHAGLPTEDTARTSRRSTTRVRRLPRRTRRGRSRQAPSSACATTTTPRSGSRITTRSSPAAGTRIKRDQALDGDGVAAEVVYPDADAVESRTCVPFGAGLGLSGDLDPELGHGRRQGAQPVARRAVRAQPRASLRRRRSCPSPVELDDVLAEIRRAKESRPRRGDDPRDVGATRPPYHDRRYDPVWALCEELRCPW